MLGLDRPSDCGSDCCAKIKPGSKNAMIGIDKILIDIGSFEGRL
jgi:hypothetical protein